MALTKAIHRVESFALGAWTPPDSGARAIESAITGERIAEAGNDALPFADMANWARATGAVALQEMTFHARARMLKAIALHLNERREILYNLSYDTGATLRDHKIDIDGGIGTLLVYASKGRRELPDTKVYLDGPPEQLGRAGNFLGQHICVPKKGVAVHINAYNFPVWGMLEKLAPTWLAGLPAIVKPATATCYVTEACVRLIVESGLLPQGALQLISGGIGDLLDHTRSQDVVTFTGSAATGLKLRSHPTILAHAVPFTAEQDSLNASLLAPDATPGAAEFDLFLKEVVQEMTVKAGQKCTAIRRVLVPDARLDTVVEGLADRLSSIKVGDPRESDTHMGALVSRSQRSAVHAACEVLETEADCVFQSATLDDGAGAFMTPRLYRCDDPDRATRLHDTEAFGPVATVLGYRDLDHAIDLVNRGGGSLVTSLITHDPATAVHVATGIAPFNGRIYINNRTAMAEATGHGAPLPHMVHGGPGRAGGSEELGGIRAVLHYMQRTAIQGSPDMLSAIGSSWMPGASKDLDKQHPFKRRFGTLDLGDAIQTEPRTVTLEDIEHFAHFTGDTFYAHMDEEAAKANPFFPGRVAHGYLLLSFAAGLFVEPDPGPVLANTGLDNLRFMAPVSPGDAIHVNLTVKSKTPRNDAYGEVRWHVQILNQDETPVADYELLTMNAI